MDTRADRSRSWNKKGTKGRVSATAPSTPPKDTEKQRAEGRCFNCNKQGHISRNCPDKNKGKPKTPNKPTVQARKIKTENSRSDADSEPEADDPDSFIKRTRAMKEDHKREIMLMAIAADKKEEGSDQDF
jgi:N-acetylmuramoyl-L-alanine amidase CwlA